jgi:hypothetical protein
MIYPEFPTWRSEPYTSGLPVKEGFRYSSDRNSEWLTAEELQEMLPTLSPAIGGVGAIHSPTST